MKPTRREYVAIALLALLVAGGMAAVVPAPGYTDAFYYFNAGARLAAGDGLTDPYIALTYLNAPESLPAPSHTYWMPLTSLLVALAGGSFPVAQVFFGLLWLGMVLLAFWLGSALGGSRRHAWGAGLLVIFPGYFAPFLVTTDTFTPFGLFGAGSLLAMGLGRKYADWRGYAIGGALVGLAHLTRADGVLLLGVLILLALLPSLTDDERSTSWRGRVVMIAFGLSAYLLVMAPWFVRNLRATGSPLPVGGTATIWLRGYNEIVSYPPQMTPANFLAWGAGNVLASRWEAFTNNLGTFVAVEGVVVLAPLLVIGVGRRWRHPLLLPVWIYAVALHAAMTLVFAYPGYRGGLFHSAAALLPWWMAAGLLGLDDVIDWIAARRRHWQPRTAKRFFTAAVIALAVLLTGAISAARVANLGGVSPLIRAAQILPSDAVVMSNDPAAVYYHTGLGGVVVPDAGPEAVRALAAQYGVTHLLLDANRTQPLDDVYQGRDVPDFLHPLPQDAAPDVRVFEVIP